ncbi:TIGR04282 family arsenosugar biosynthesis glycosyltransferase [Calditrichota bacterium]
MTEKAALIIFAKSPMPNYAKTRLIDPLSAAQAAEFYANCIKDISLIMKDETVFDFWFGIAPEKFDTKIWPIDLKNYRHFFQKGANLGERMVNAFNLLFDKSYKKVAIIGSDFPHISPKLINEAFAKLDHCDCVLGPSKDGGYYLIALKKKCNPLFKNINWSTNKVYSQTFNQAKKNGIKIYTLDTHYDVDTIVELKRLYHDLKIMDQSKPEFPFNVWNFIKNDLNTLFI